MKKNIIIIFSLAIVLALLSFFVIRETGDTYILVSDKEAEVELKQDKKIVEIVDKKVEDGRTKVKLKSVSKGKATIYFKYNDDFGQGHVIYVHNFGVITENNFFGDATNDIVIPISISIIILVSLIMIIKEYMNSMKENMYQYKNIAYLGIIIFLLFSWINQTLTIFNYRGLVTTIHSINGIFGFLSIIILPIAFVVSIFVTISNIVLSKKEGFSYKNILGIFLGLFLCVASITPEILNIYLSQAQFINVHNLNGIGYLIQTFIETLIYMVTAYLECILLATIILGAKAARHIPEFNKDYMLILGCMIKKDGNLTNLLKARADRAIEFKKMQEEKTGKRLILVPSGGQGSDEIISEGEAIKNYLIKEGISEKDILVEDKSTNTLENIKFSVKLINNKKANIAYSTTNFHVFRAGSIGTSLSLKLEGIGSKTKRYFWINAFIREFIATIYSEKKKHTLMFIILIILTTIMMGIIHLSNQL